MVILRGIEKFLSKVLLEKRGTVVVLGQGLFLVEDRDGHPQIEGYQVIVSTEDPPPSQVGDYRQGTIWAKIAP